MLTLLPYELQLKVVEATPPKDTYALSSTCKWFQELCRKRLHQDRECMDFLYTSGPLSYPANEPLVSLAPSYSLGVPRLLVDIARNPRLACCLEELSPDAYYQDPKQDMSEESCLKLILQLVRRSSMIQDNELGDWTDAITTGRGGAFLGLLFSQLTALRKIQLEIRADDLIIPYASRAISRLAARSQQGFLDQGMSALVDARVECISAADSADGEGDDGWDSSDSIEEEREFWPRARFTDDHYPQLARLLIALSRLPNLQNLSLADYYSQPVWGKGLDGSGPDMYDWNDANDSTYPLPPPSSQLRSIIVDRGNISAPALCRLLEGSSSFKEFRYLVFHTPEVFGQRLQGVQYQQHRLDMCIESVCGALLKHAKSTLQHLHIELAEYGSICGCRHEPCQKLNPFGSINPAAPPTTNWKLNEFTALGRLTLDIDLFSNVEGGGWLPLAKTLPVSIEDVVILAGRCPPKTDTLDFENMFSDFKPQVFANLRSISAWHRGGDFYQLGHNGASHILAIYEAALHNAGIPRADIRGYKLNSEYFAQRDKGFRPHRSGIDMNRYGMNDHSLYAIPDRDLIGKVVFGVYHSEGGVRDRKDIYTGVIVDKAVDSAASFGSGVGVEMIEEDVSDLYYLLAVLAEFAL
ncbi:hypothetical protein BBP40_011264 [Aspergillus hancockii]|nr:hypothetical protein BBP40_011264 [Aspergillus hancockii]